jgi:hypothetical protein
MKNDEIGQIREYAAALTSLRDWRVDNVTIDRDEVERLEPPGMNRTNRIAQRMRYAWDDVLRPHAAEFRSMATRLLGDSAWDSIAVNLEGYNAETARRLGDIRRTILNAVLSDDGLRAALEVHGGSFGLTGQLDGLIAQLIEALQEVANRAESELKTETDPVIGSEGHPDGNENRFRDRLGRLLLRIYETTLKALFEAAFKHVDK